MLTGVNVLSGKVSFNIKEDKFDNDILFDALEMLEVVIEVNFNHISHDSTSRFGSDYCEPWEPILNKEELHSNNLVGGDAVSFYSHSKYLNMDRLIKEYKEFLKEIPYAEAYNGLSIQFEYTQIEFSDSEQSIRDVQRNTRNVYIRVEDGDVEIIQSDIYGKTSLDFEIMDIERETNLLAFNGNTYLGVSNLYEQMAMLHEQSDKLDWFKGFSSKNVQMVAQVLSEALGRDKYGATIEQDTYRMTEILEGTMDENYLIGTPELLRYVDEVSPLILGRIMESGNIR